MLGVKIFFKFILMLIFLPFGIVALYMTISDFDGINLFLAIIGLGIGIPVTLSLIKDNKQRILLHYQKKDNAKEDFVSTQDEKSLIEEKEQTVIIPDEIEGLSLTYAYHDVNVAVPENISADYLAERVTLTKEPENVYDPKAIALYIGEVKIGYLYKGRLQDMANDFIRKELPIIAYLTQINLEDNKANIFLGFYKKPKYDVLKDKGVQSKIYKLSGTAKQSFQENINFCEIGDPVDAEYDYEKEKYIAICHDEIGYFPKSLNKILDEKRYIFIENIEIDANDKTTVSVEIFEPFNLLAPYTKKISVIEGS